MFTENAPLGIGAQLHKYLMDKPGLITMAEWNSHDDTLGVPSANEHRTIQTENTAHLLAIGGISFSENMRVHPDIKLDAYQDEMIRQLLGWERVPIAPKDPTKPVTWHWSAKHTTGNDDSAISLLMLTYALLLWFLPYFFPRFWPFVFMKKPRYALFIQQVINKQDGGKYLTQGAHLPTPLSDIPQHLIDKSKRILHDIGTEVQANKKSRLG